MTKFITIIKLAGLTIFVVFLIGLIYGYVSEIKANSVLQVATEKWEQKYNIAVTAQQVSEETITHLRANNATLQVELLAWRAGYEKINQKQKATQLQIKELEANNEEIRDILNITIPGELWRGIFPGASGHVNANNSN